jgi:hypothetical protein
MSKMKKMLVMPNELNGRLKRIALDAGVSVNRLIVDCLEREYPASPKVSESKGKAVVNIPGGVSTFEEVKGGVKSKKGVVKKLQGKIDSVKPDSVKSLSQKGSKKDGEKVETTASGIVIKNREVVSQVDRQFGVFRDYKDGVKFNGRCYMVSGGKGVPVRYVYSLSDV